MAGALRGPQMGSFVENDGRPIGCGQFFMALDPGHFSGSVFGKIAGTSAAETARS